MTSIGECRTCGTQFAYVQDKVLHDCSGTPVKICPSCNLTKPCECDE